MFIKSKICKALIGSGLAIILILIGAVIAEGAISGTYFDFGGKRVTNAGTPTAANDVGTKGYVDAATSGTFYTYYCFSAGSSQTPVCANAGGTQGYCPAGFKQKLALGSWGYCQIFRSDFGYFSFFRPPGGSCGDPFGQGIRGQAYICSQ